MFASKSRDVVFPQLEHSRLAGLLASLWGNDAFLLPLIPFSSFLRGVMYHDRGYETLDNDPIGEVGEERWLEIQRVGFENAFEDPIADIVARLHLVRLIGHGESKARQKTAGELDARVRKLVAETSFSYEDFLRADSITDFCDTLSYQFCFEVPKKGTSAVSSDPQSDQYTEVRYQLVDEGVFFIDPWPFRVPEYQSYITAYEASGYPEKRKPVPAPVVLKPLL